MIMEVCRPGEGNRPDFRAEETHLSGSNGDSGDKDGFDSGATGSIDASAQDGEYGWAWNEGVRSVRSEIVGETHDTLPRQVIVKGIDFGTSLLCQFRDGERHVGSALALGAEGSSVVEFEHGDG